MYHVNPETGEAGKCNAAKGRCPFGGQEDHYHSIGDARTAFENAQKAPRSLTKVIRHEMKLTADVKRLLSQLYSDGLTPYIVGGSVRDSVISGAQPKDIDIEVFGLDSMEQLEKSLRSHGYMVDSVGQSFGVFKLRTKSGEDIDISLPRRDSKVGDGHRGFEVEVDPKLTLEDAAGRRDFTVNALYYSEREKRIRDPFGGMEDWEKGQLRHINEYFGDDPLRVIRGIQFAGRFRMDLAPETAELARSMRPEFANLSEERIQTEFEKLFAKGSLARGAKALRATDWDYELFNNEVNEEFAERGDQAIARAKTFEDDEGVFGAGWLLRSTTEKEQPRVAGLMLKGLKRQQKSLRLLQEKAITSLDEKSVRAWARSLGKRGLTIRDLYIFSGNQEIAEAGRSFRIFEAPDPDLLTGSMILQTTGEKPGPWVGKLLSEANKAQDERVFTDKVGAIHWLKTKVK